MSTRVSYFPPEDRRDRRYPLPTLIISIGGVEYGTVNWSIGGFLITGFDRKVVPGQAITGMMRPVNRPEGLPFTATVVRSGDPEPGYLAAKFEDLSELGLSMLERIITRRLFRS
ncbi:MAG TPA: PilZ domain-containing protein [Stellaceae bacterium]|jgi:hypothetical protein|nr:PilZ domain-containing protein [Stellaceae bacterium]